jgi:hypothetical protein
MRVYRYACNRCNLNNRGDVMKSHIIRVSRISVRQLAQLTKLGFTVVLV